MVHVMNCLAILAILLSFTIVVRSPDDKNALKMRRKTTRLIMYCKNKAMKTSCFRTLTSTEKILDNITYRADPSFNCVYDEMLKKTAFYFQIFNKCALKTCLRELISIGFIHVIPSENIDKMVNERWDEYPNKISRLTSYQNSYYVYLSINVNVKRLLMNLNEYCPAKICTEEIKRSGFGFISGNTNQKLLMETSLKDENFYSKGEIVQEYKFHLENTSQPIKKDVDVYCIEIVCLIEIRKAGFENDYDGVKNKIYLNENRNDVIQFFVHNFVVLYIDTLDKTKENIPGSIPFCESVSIHGIFIKELSD